jgi:hypothetical protein
MELILFIDMVLLAVGFLLLVFGMDPLLFLLSASD